MPPGCETVSLIQAVTKHLTLTGEGFIITDSSVYLLNIPDLKAQASINLPTGARLRRKNKLCYETAL